MKRSTLFSFSTAFFSAALVAYVVVACSSDEDKGGGTPDSGASSGTSGTSGGSSGTSGGSSGTSGGSSGTSGSSGDGSTKPQPPTLGAQIDRMGRPAINTALNKTFAGSTMRDSARDAYNADKNNAAWVTTNKAEIAGNLAIFDGIDQSCGNQAFANAASPGPAADKYGTLASVLADDRLWLDTSSATCTQYLGVELNATGAVPNTDCGGRTLKYDVIDVTYTALASTLAGPVTDGIDADPVKTGGTTFPYLAAP